MKLTVPRRRKIQKKISDLTARIKKLREGQNVATGSWAISIDNDIERAETDLKLLRELATGQIPIQKESAIRKMLPDMRRDIDHLNSIVLANQAVLASIERVKVLLKYKSSDAAPKINISSRRVVG